MLPLQSEPGVIFALLLLFHPQVMACFFLLGLLLLNLFKDVISGEESNVYSPIEAYWHSMLPHTSMPNVIRDLIHPAGMASLHQLKFHSRQNWCNKALSADVLNHFILKEHIYPGAIIKEGISFARIMNGNAFIPRIEADKVQFTSKELSRILNRLSISPGTKEAKQIEEILCECENPECNVLMKFCVTSLESMIDNVVSALGTKDIQVNTTTIYGRAAQNEKAVYRVASGGKKLPQQKFVLCHPQPLLHAVYYCHMIPALEVYAIPLKGNDGTKVNALAVCHTMTEGFNPLIFELLNIKPGAKPVCHFLPEDHLMWTPAFNYEQLY